MHNDIIQSHLARHESVLVRLLEQTPVPASRIREATLYCLFPGGKRLRPLLVYLCGQLVSVDIESLDIIAAAIELTHCYSLVHDDLPAMDDDDYRRGKLSCHRAFDEATAILVGDGLQALAMDLLLHYLPKTLSPNQVINIAHELVKACGPAGMVSGQSLDLSELTNTAISEAMLCEIHALKTGKLILACVNMVLAASNRASKKEQQALQQFATHLGLVFQMQDDYLDRYDQQHHLGKGRASDLANNKQTFASLHSQASLFDAIHDHFTAVEQALSYFGDEADTLRQLIHSLYLRTHTMSTLS